MKKIISFILAVTLMLSACALLASCGADGVDGKTPYIGENGNWWIGDTDLGVPATGPKGEDGKDGEDGKPAELPYIGENGNWWIGDTDLGVPARGPEGEDGNDGAEGKPGDTPYIGENGNWWTGTTDTGVKAKGEDGKPGDTPYIGDNGNWWIGDTDLGVPATGNSGTTDPDEPKPEEPEEPGEEIGTLDVKKESSHKYLRTVHPGDDIIYTFTVKNGTNVKKQFDITDVIPENTAYKSGDATVSGNSLTISVEADAGETVTVSYTVTVTDDLAKRGTAIVSGSAEYLGNKISCEDVYIGVSFNEYDMQKLSMAVSAMRNSEFKGKDLLKYFFYISFGLSQAIGEEADAVANALFIDSTLGNSEKYASIVIPGLYGGKMISASHKERFAGEATTEISCEDVFPGDVILVLQSANDVTGAKFYITDGAKFYDVTGKMTETVSDFVLDSAADADYFAVLRPISYSTSVNYFRTQSFYEGKTDIEKAIIAASTAFYLRGGRMQYDDAYMATSVPRWERNKTPEDYTVDEIGYSDCTGFIHDVYYTAFGWDYGSHALYNSPSSWFVYDYYLTNTETDEEKAAVERDMMAILQPGDIIYYRYSTNNHGMLYLGNGNLIHCTGNPYLYSGSYNGQTAPLERQEPAIRFHNLRTLFTGGDRYIFNTEKPRSRVMILRPTNAWKGQLPDSTVSRIQNMQGIVAEKLVSHTLGQTVNPGELITYTFKIYNSNRYAVTLNVKDAVPEGTSLMIDGNPSTERNLSWNVELAPGEEKLVSYTVKVSDTADDGYAITCSTESSVGGVPVRSTRVYVGRTLTETEQKAILEAVYACINKGIKGAELVDLIYKTALGVDGIIGTSISDVCSAIFLTSGEKKALATEGKFAQMIAPTLYGGKNVLNSNRFNGERTRFVWERNLVVGDVLIYAKSSRFYMYVGDGKFVDMETFKDRDAYERLEETIGWGEFAIIRPSLALEN